MKGTIVIDGTPRIAIWSELDGLRVADLAEHEVDILLHALAQIRSADVDALRDAKRDRELVVDAHANVTNEIASSKTGS
jgi:hypothetical protein